MIAPVQKIALIYAEAPVSRADTTKSQGKKTQLTRRLRANARMLVLSAPTLAHRGGASEYAASRSPADLGAFMSS